MQAAHRGAKDGSIQSAVLFSHFADEFGLRGGILFIQHLTKGVSIDAWRDPKSDWLKGDPHRMPFELATDPTVSNFSMHAWFSTLKIAKALCHESRLMRSTWIDGSHQAPACMLYLSP